MEGLIRDEELASSEVSYCSEHSRKSNAMYALVKELKEANVPIDEVGFQVSNMVFTLTAFSFLADELTVES